MKKRIMALALTLLLILALSACGSKNKAPEEPDAPEVGENAPAPPDVPEEDTPEPAKAESGDTKTMSYFSEYVSTGSYTTEMKTEYEGITNVSLTAYDGDNMYSESETNGTKSIVIMKDGYQYILDPASKTCIKMSAEMMQDTEEIFADTEDSYAAAVSTGDMDVDGTSCYYEEFQVEGMSVKYCFDGDALRYIISDMDGASYRVEILSMKKGADKSLFEVPSDYTVMEY